MFNRFGIVITGTYWITLGLSILSVLLFSVLDVFFPSYLWMVAGAAAIVILGRIAAKSCSAGGNGFHIGRGFLWSYISLVIGTLTAHIIVFVTGWKDIPAHIDYSVSYHMNSDIVYDRMNTITSRIMELLQSPGAYVWIDLIQILYLSVFIALITGALIKNK